MPCFSLLTVMSHRENKELLFSDFGLTHSYFNRKKIWLELTRFVFSDDLGNASNDISSCIFSVPGHSMEECKVTITIVDLIFWTERYNSFATWRKPLTLLVSFCCTSTRKGGEFKQIKNLLNSAKSWLEEKVFIGKHIFLICFPSNSVLRPRLIAAK